MIRGAHPEFGYFSPSPNLRRKLWLATVTGLLVGAGGLGMFMTRGNLPKAFALAQIEGLGTEPSSTTPRTEPAAPLKPAVAKQLSEVESGRAPCQDRKSTDSNGNCDSPTVRKPIRALNERPAIAAVSIGHTDGAPAATASEAPAAINTPPVVSAPPVVNAPPVESPALAAAAEKPPAERAASPAKTKPPGRVAVMDRPPRPHHQRMSERAEHLDEFGREAGKLHNHVRQRMGHYNLSGLERLGPELSRALAQFLR